MYYKSIKLSQHHAKDNLNTEACMRPRLDIQRCQVRVCCDALMIRPMTMAVCVSYQTVFVRCKLSCRCSANALVRVHGWVNRPRPGKNCRTVKQNQKFNQSTILLIVLA